MSVVLWLAALCLGVAAMVVVAPIFTRDPHRDRRPPTGRPPHPARAAHLIAAAAGVTAVGRLAIVALDGLDVASVVTLAACAALVVISRLLGRVLRERQALLDPHPDTDPPRQETDRG